jgi:hypothetical protein
VSKGWEGEQHVEPHTWHIASFLALRNLVAIGHRGLRSSRTDQARYMDTRASYSGTAQTEIGRLIGRELH